MKRGSFRRKSWEDYNSGESVERRKRNLARRAQREIRRMAADRRRYEEAESQAGRSFFTDWERDFWSGVPDRLSEWGRAFSDPMKASPMDPLGPLSRLQAAKAREIRKLMKERILEEQERQPVDPDVEEF